MTAQPRSPGRPRDATIDDDIVRSLFELVEEIGLGAVTIDAIAERAGVGKTTIYRRWSSKEDLIVDAVAGLVGGIEIPEGDGIREVLLHALGRIKSFMSKTTAGVILPWMIAEVARGTDVGRRYAETVIIPGRKALAGHISDAVSSGELRSDLDVEMAVDMLLGPLIVSKLLSRYREPHDAWAEGFIDALLDGWRAPTGGEARDPA
jgi:AcrR family transcriptional regulator